MSNGSNFATWQKVAVIFIVIFGVIIAFSYFQSSHLPDQDQTALSNLPPLEETATQALDVAPPAPSSVTAGLTPVQSQPVSEQKIQDIGAAAPQDITIIPPAPAVTASVPEKVPSTKSVKKDVAAKTTPAKGTYKIQVASFKEAAKANKLLAKLKDGGYEAKIAERNLGEKGTWYQVLVGPFTNKVEAETNLSELKTTYKESFIKRQ